MTILVRKKSQSKAFRSRGVSLIEVMVTLVLVSVGVLGFASLQGQSQMAELQSAEYAYASRMVNSMAEQLRADADYGNKCLGSSYNSATTKPPTDMACATIAHVTTTNSINTWVGELSQSKVNSITAGGLPDPAGCIGFTAATGDMPALYTIEVAWDGTNELAHVATDCAGSSASMRNSVTTIVVVPDFLLPSLDCSNNSYAAANPLECVTTDCSDTDDCPSCFADVIDSGGTWYEMRGEENNSHDSDYAPSPFNLSSVPDWPEDS
mgnify:CR=1 FL=1